MKKKTILLGAGAAAAATEGAFPTMGNFFDHEKIIKAERGFKELHNFLTSFVGSKSEITKANMEEVITHLETSLNGYGRDWGAATTSQLGKLETARTQFFSYLSERLSVPEKYQSEGPNLYRRLLENFDQSSDSILTLNYDLLMDIALESIPPSFSQAVQAVSSPDNPPKESISRRSKGLLSQQGLSLSERVAYPQHYSSPGLYLKLHGSLNWLTCPNRSCANHSIISSESLNPKDSLIGSPCYRCGNAVIPVVVPPTMQKNLNLFPKLGLIWNLALQKLKESDELILIGISLPESDYYLRWLLREATRLGSQKTITLVTRDPDNQARERAKSIFGRSGDLKNHKLLFCKEVEHFFSGRLEPL